MRFNMVVKYSTLPPSLPPSIPPSIPPSPPSPPSLPPSQDALTDVSVSMLKIRGGLMGVRDSYVHRVSNFTLSTSFINIWCTKGFL